MANEVQDLTRRFMAKWTSGDPEMRKQAEYAVQSYIRLKLRENGIVRSQLLPALKIEAGQLDKDIDPKVMKKFMEIEPDSQAVSLPFRAGPSQNFIEGRFLPVYFEKIESEEHVVNIIELINYNNDLRKILNEQDIKNLQTVEDGSFIRQLDAIAAANPVEQLKNFFGGLTKVNWASSRQQFFIDKPIKFALMNTRTAIEFAKWDYMSDFGFGTHGAELYQKGSVTNPQGIQLIQTIKSDLVPDGVVFLFAPEDFIGKFFTYQEPTTFIEQKKDWLSFSTYEIIGIGIGNTRCFTKNIFNP